MNDNLNVNDDETLDVKWGDPALIKDDGFEVGGEQSSDGYGFYIHPEGTDEEDIYYVCCPLCGDNGSIYGGNRFGTQACCYFHINDKNISLEVERWVTDHLLAGESIEEVHAKLTALRTHPPLRSYVERINAILRHERTAADYKKYLVQGDRTGSDPEADSEKATDAAALGSALNVRPRFNAF